MTNYNLIIWLATVTVLIVSVTSLIIYDQWDDEQTSIKIKPPFGTLTCDEINKQNAIGMHIANNDTTFSQERIIECMNEIVDELEYRDINHVKKYCIDSNGVYHKDKCYSAYKNWEK